jgi:hypothetical protein
VYPIKQANEKGREMERGPTKNEVHSFGRVFVTASITKEKKKKRKVQTFCSVWLA